MGGKSFNRGLGVAIGLAAAIAIPFAAPALAGVMLGSTAVTAGFVATSAAIGAGLGVAAGALSGSLTGNAGRGALLGGLGGAAGGFLGSGGAGMLFGSSAPAAAAPVAGEGTAAVTGATAAPTSGAEVAAATQGGVGGAGTAAPTVAPATGGATTGIGGASAPAVNAPSIAGMTPEGAMASLPSTPTAATTGVGPQTWGERFMSTFSPTPAPGATQAPSIFTAEGLGAAANKGVSQLMTPAGLAGVGQLAMTMFNKPPEGLTPQERDYLKETAEMASSNRALFEQRVDAARRMLNQGTPNPEMAYAQANMATQRQFREAGLRTPEDERRAAIAGARRGAAAVPAEMTRAAEATRVGLAMMPSATPRGYESYALEATRDAERRQREYQADLARSFGALGGALGGRRNEKLF